MCLQPAHQRAAIVEPIGEELDHGIRPRERDAVVGMATEGHDEVQSPKARFAKALLPKSKSSRVFRHLAQTIHHEHRLAIDLNVILVPEERQQVVEMTGPFLGTSILLIDQNFPVEAIPSPRPGFIGPRDAERKIRLPVLQHSLQRLLEEQFSGKPIVIVAEAIYSMRLGQFGLPLTDGSL